MNTDVSTNVVVFRLRRTAGDIAIAEGPTQAEDCVRQAWAVASQRHQAAPSEVTALHSEWEPSAADAGFIQRAFPEAKLTYNFSRPGPDGWEAAFAAARQTIAQAAERHAAARGQQGMQHVAEHGQLLPILWSHRSPKREMLQHLPYRELVLGRIFVTLATVAPTPHGTIGMNHVTNAGLKGRSFADLMTVAAQQLGTGLRVDVRADSGRPELGKLLTVRRDGPCAASAVALPDFHRRMSDVLGTDRLVAGLPGPETLLVAAQASGWAGEVRRAVLGSACPDSELVPTLLSMTRSGYTVLAER
jgi:hypothetical protein